MNLILFLLAVVAGDPAPQLKQFRQTQPHMGVLFEIALYAPDEATAKQGFDAAFARVAELNKVMSDYDLDSELMKLSLSSPHDRPQPVSEDLWRVLEKSDAMARASEGAFDITVGPLTRIWRRARRQKEKPTDEEIREAMQAVGWNKVELSPKGRAVRLTHGKMRLDLGGIGQGVAADEALAVLRKMGLPCAMVDASGDIALGDPPPGEKGWRIGIAPLAPKDPPSRFLLLANYAVSTSGDAYQFVEFDGKRYSHIVDPKTGFGLTHRISVTVVARNCTEADALDTAVCVLGIDKGLALVESRAGTAALITVAPEGKAELVESKLWKVYSREVK